MLPLSFGPEKRGENQVMLWVLPFVTKRTTEEVDQSNTETTAEVYQGGRTTDPQAMGKPAEGNKLRERLRDVLWRVSRLTVSSKTGELVN